MAKKAGYYIDKDGDTWLRLGSLGFVYSRANPLISLRSDERPRTVWSWKDVTYKWGPMTLDEEIDIL